MSIKWLVIFLVGIFIIAGVIGYFLFSLKNSKEMENIVQNTSNIETIKQQVSVEPFDYIKDRINGTILEKTGDEDGNLAFKLYISWPPNAPIYDDNYILPIQCSEELSNLVSVKTDSETQQYSEETVARGINVYEQAEINDSLKAECLNQYCSVIGGACELLRVEKQN